MLRGIPACLSPDLVHALMTMDAVVVTSEADGNLILRKGPVM